MQPSDPTLTSPATLTVAEAEGYLQRAQDTQPLFSGAVALLCGAAIPNSSGCRWYREWGRASASPR
ncbi:hypothetical protein [Lawsonella clevelandensis]|uniref:Uncharacterized protein n=1 Tax=Lawsonella clevelandensis TaxID=1528099 RepID=A0A5E3ZY47_9ACTN|nr:hypothetical protein [Lawsonella clevelandensis]VHO01092.1 hypothetical protein LC603019_01148 [Lawsonella clevelandensis]